jgi:hypothetical protein
MARFYAEIVSNSAKTPASRINHELIRVTIKSWQGEVNVEMWRRGDIDMVLVKLEPHGGGGTDGITDAVILYNGPCAGWKEYNEAKELGKLALDQAYQRKTA